LVHAVDTLRNEFLVFPAVLEDVPEHPVDRGNVCARAYAYIFGRVRGSAAHARIEHDEIRAIELLAFEQMLQRHRMRFRGIATHKYERLGIADVVVAVGHRAVAPRIGYAGDGSRMANARLVVDVVRAPERRKLAEQI